MSITSNILPSANVYFGILRRSPKQPRIQLPAPGVYVTTKTPEHTGYKDYVSTQNRNGFEVLELGGGLSTDRLTQGTHAHDPELVVAVADSKLVVQVRNLLSGGVEPGGSRPVSRVIGIVSEGAINQEQRLLIEAFLAATRPNQHTQLFEPVPHGAKKPNNPLAHVISNYPFSPQDVLIGIQEWQEVSHFDGVSSENADLSRLLRQSEVVRDIDPQQIHQWLNGQNFAQLSRSLGKKALLIRCYPQGNRPTIQLIG